MKDSIRGPRRPNAALVLRLDSGFTLVELLIAIGILAVLAGLFASSLSVARGSALTIDCNSRLKQMAAALQMYADDNNGFLPGAFQWERGVLSYLRVRPPFPCPAIRNFNPHVFRWSGDVIAGYAFNGYLAGLGVPAWQRRHSLHEAEIQWMSSTVAICDSRDEIFNITGPDVNEFVGKWPGPVEEGGRRHRGGANYAFLDGHVKWYRPENVDGIQSNRRPDGSRPSFRPF